MTNEVEKLILDNLECENISFKEHISYLIYKEIWNFIIEMLKYNFDSIKVSFNIKKIGTEYTILKADNIKYSLINGNEISSYYGEYENCDYSNINLYIKSVFDLNTLYKLLSSDKFSYNVSIYKERIVLNAIIDKDKINNIINDILLKNSKVKKLSKEV